MSFSVSLPRVRDQRLGRALGGLGTVVAWRQPVIVPQIRGREQVLAGGDPGAHFDDLAFEVGGVDFELLDQLAVDEESADAPARTDSGDGRSARGGSCIRHPPGKRCITCAEWRVLSPVTS